MIGHPAGGCARSTSSFKTSSADLIYLLGCSIAGLRLWLGGAYFASWPKCQGSVAMALQCPPGANSNLKAQRDYPTVGLINTARVSGRLRRNRPRSIVDRSRLSSRCHSRQIRSRNANSLGKRGTRTPKLWAVPQVRPADEAWAYRAGA
jgi:hypothetical protein